MRAGWLALVLCAALLVPRTTGAAAGIEVILVRAPRAGAVVGEATVRLAAELRAVGFSVRLIDGAPGVDGRALVEGAGAPVATIVLLETDRGPVADAWVADRVTKRTLVRRMELGDPGVTNAASDLAVRSAELLRASLLELSGAQRRELPAQVAQWLADAAPTPTAAPPPTPAAAPPPAATAPAWPQQPPRATRVDEPAPAAPAAPARERTPADRREANGAPAAAPRRAPGGAAPRARPAGDRRLSLEAGLAALAGDVGIVAGPYLRIEHDLPAGLSLRGTLVPAVAEKGLDAPAGRAALRQTAALLGLAYAAGGDERRIYPLLALGAGVYHLTVEGEANSPHRDKHQAWFTAGIAAGAGVGIRILPYLTALAELDVLLLAREPRVTIAGAEVGRTGRPALLPCLGLKLSL
ncbi:hypothetical protein SOCEGT47_059890 [Sorangium cellulosum]|uniref:Secreted protein n=1 Tax=Sorangium cellulosum TaxID=56 RepID=A0A4V0NEA0_SORCE|nr:hypothetical protein [Sorangium cellulosum]AUX25442.1 hypothetical protein SOCEGT47_059890 [Sorangium cellulosum]